MVQRPSRTKMPLYSRLTREQRYTIESMLRNGAFQKDIAAVVGVNPSGVSREIRRGGMTAATYRGATAQAHSKALQSSGKRLPAGIWPLVTERLCAGQWSPQQISAILRRDGIADVSHESIYQHIYADKRSGGSLHRHLRHRCKSYRKRGLGRERRGQIRNQVSIDQRPAVVAERSRVGDWELDTVIGKPGGPVLVTMVERKSRYTFIALAANKEASGVTDQIFEAMRLVEDRVKTLTFDNGKEFAQHQRLAQMLGAQTYFAHPYRSWERGLNENTNGLIRQYFPKGSDFRNLSPSRVKEVEYLLNRRPRKCLAYQTPYDIFNTSPPIALAA